MAGNPKTVLVFKGRCPDCAERIADLPAPLPQVGDDFDWMVRDFDSFRRFMLEELAARFPERTRWTPADMEVVIVEVFAAVLDQLSDMLDRTAAEAFLETARRPESVRRLLSFIGYDAVTAAGLKDANELERLWTRNPSVMESARRQGPNAVHTQRRMVTVDDYARLLKEHPLVLSTHAWSRWTGSWPTIQVAVILWNNCLLDQRNILFPEELKQSVDRFHTTLGLFPPVWDPAPPSMRTILRPFLDHWRMTGQETLLMDAQPVGISMSLSIRISDNYFRSEIRQAVKRVLGTGPRGFFEPGRLGFGQDIFAGDIFQALMSLDGVESVCLNRFKRFGDRFPDQSDTGIISLNELEIPVCDNDPERPERGFYHLSLHGGRRG